jgi:hypothetical protein
MLRISRHGANYAALAEAAKTFRRLLHESTNTRTSGRRKKSERFRQAMR